MRTLAGVKLLKGDIAWAKGYDMVRLVSREEAVVRNLGNVMLSIIETANWHLNAKKKILGMRNGIEGML